MQTVSRMTGNAEGLSHDTKLRRNGKRDIFTGFNRLLPITNGAGKRETLVTGINPSPDQSGGYAKGCLSC